MVTAGCRTAPAGSQRDDGDERPAIGQPDEADPEDCRPTDDGEERQIEHHTNGEDDEGDDQCHHSRLARLSSASRHLNSVG